MQLKGNVLSSKAGARRWNNAVHKASAIRKSAAPAALRPAEAPASSAPVTRYGLEHWQRKLAAAMVALAVTSSPGVSLAEEVPAATSSLGGREAPEAVYFGNGCFWGRQYDFVNTEMAMGRGMGEASAVVGYAGGTETGPGGKVCYYLADPKSVYEKLGHAEVVQVTVSGDPSSSPKAAQEFRSFADTYFKQFKKTPIGMMRSDPQDVGPGYRNVVGLPGGIRSPFFPILQEANANGMELREGSGNVFNGKKPSEDDIVNVVWIVDSTQLPFYRAEKYHQYHTGIGKMFPWEYLVDMKNAAAKSGKIGPTGCPELPF